LNSKADLIFLRKVPHSFSLKFLFLSPTLTKKEAMELPDRVHRNFDHRPRRYTDQVLNMLEDKTTTGEKYCPQDVNERQSESIASIQMERTGALAGKESQSGSRHGTRVLSKRGRESEAVDAPSSGLHMHAKYGAEQ
jgi:hypothetical protein